MTTLRYNPQLNPLTGGINSTLLMLQLEYWFTHTEGKPFFKFLEPCEDLNYRTGDSWCEELGFTKAEFRSAFAKIGKVYKSKKAYQESEDKFEGHLYASYYDRIKRLTYYMRNHELVETQLATFCPACEPLSRNTESPLPISVDYSTSLPLENTSACESILETYHQICKDLPKVESLTPTMRQKLTHFWHTIQEDQTLLRKVFEKVKDSDFLSGRLPGKSFRATLFWILKGTKYLDILGDKYRNRQTKPRPRFNRILTHDWDYAQLESMEQNYIEQKLKDDYNPSSPLMARLLDQLHKTNA